MKKTLRLLEEHDLTGLESYQDIVHVKLRENPPTCNMVFIDDRDVLITPLIPYADTDTVPSFEFHRVPGGYYAHYRSSYETVWVAARPLDPEDLRDR